MTVKAKVGQHILQVAHDNDIDLEGACEASLACSTCHVYVEGDYFKKLPEACEEEEDLLDLAFGLQPVLFFFQFNLLFLEFSIGLSNHFDQRIE